MAQKEYSTISVEADVKELFDELQNNLSKADPATTQSDVMRWMFEMLEFTGRVDGHTG